MTKELINITGFTEYVPDNISIYFGKKETIGRLYEEDGVFKFDGDMEESAKLFMDFLSKQYQKTIENKAQSMIEEAKREAVEEYEKCNGFKSKLIKGTEAN